MELILIRIYYKGGTNGVLQYNGTTLCRTIELPWRENMVYFSCIPEGRYQLEKRFSKKLGHHLLLRGVPGRSMILIHPANDANYQLMGCIAPVSRVIGEGRGSESRAAFNKLIKLVYDHIDKETVWLTVVSEAVAP